jgi:hypothetical protein
MQDPIVITAAARTAMGSFQTALQGLPTDVPFSAVSKVCGSGTLATVVAGGETTAVALELPKESKHA